MMHYSRHEEERRRQNVEMESRRHEDLLRRQQPLKMPDEDPFGNALVCFYFFCSEV